VGKSAQRCAHVGVNANCTSDVSTLRFAQPMLARIVDQREHYNYELHWTECRVMQRCRFDTDGQRTPSFLGPLHTLRIPAVGTMTESAKIIELVIKLGPDFFSLLRETINSNQKIEVELQMEKIGKKLDDLIVREIQSALRIIESIKNINSESMKERHLIEAERSLLKNISLDPSLATAGRNNSYWSAQAYYGLSLIAAMRKEELDASRFLLQTFVVCPSEARECFAKPFYLSVIEPECREILQTYQFRLNDLPRYLEDARKIKWSLAKAHAKQVAGMAFGAASLYFISGPQRYMAVGNSRKMMESAGKEIENLNRELSFVPTEESIKRDRDAQLDNKCREMATNLLSMQDFKG
jgi:hypothetical protein